MTRKITLLTNNVLVIVQQPVAQLPWRTNLKLMDKLDCRESRLWNAKKAIENGWSRITSLFFQI